MSGALPEGTVAEYQDRSCATGRPELELPAVGPSWHDAPAYVSHARSKSHAAIPATLWWLHGIRVLAGIALGISAFLAWRALRGGSLPGCGPESGCDEVLSSRWGYWLGVPVSLGALPIYALVLAATFALARTRSLVTPRRAWLVLAFAAVAISGAALWFVGVQGIVLHKFCPYCMTAHVCGLVLAGLIVSRLPGVVGRHRPASGPGPRLSPAAAGGAFLCGLAAVALLAAGQLLHHPRTFEVTALNPGAPTPGVFPLAPASTTAQASAVGPGSAASPVPGSALRSARELELHRGAFRLDVLSVPLLGKADAPDLMVSLFDYTCSHCRQLHRPLMETYRARSNTLAIVSLPVPLDPLCNPLVKRPLPEQTNACTYARLGLGVWRADRTRLEVFDDWVFSFPHPPSTNEVRARAESLVGAENLAKALQDPWIEDLLRTNIRLYHTNYLVYGKGRLPQLMIGTNLLVGLPGGPEDIYRLLPARQ
jgi:uncharacterized membrane protein